MHEQFSNGPIEYFKTLLDRDPPREWLVVKNRNAEKFLDDVIIMQSNGWLVGGGVGRLTTIMQEETSKEYFVMMLKKEWA